MAITSKLGAALPIVPGAASIATIVLYLADWPSPGNHGLQLAIGLGVGGLVWGLTALLFGHELTAPEGVSGRTYGELAGRLAALDARLHDFAAEENGRNAVQREAIDQAGSLAVKLHDDLAGTKPGYRWLHGNGYVNAWRDVHQAEDLLLAVEPKEIVYSAAMTNVDRFAGSAPSKTETLLMSELKALVGANGNGAAAQHDGASAGHGSMIEASVRRPGADDEERDRILERLDQDWARALVRESGYRIHRRQNDAWDKLANLRNKLFGALVLATSVLYGVLALIVLQPGDMSSVLTAAAAFFLVGAAVGVFSELYATSRESAGTVFDYGLRQTRLMTTPVLSGIAALGGVLITNLAGSFLVGGQGQMKVPALADLFSLHTYPMGLVVAAIFGLTPGLLLAQIRNRTGEYEQQIAELSPTTTDESDAARASTALLA